MGAHALGRALSPSTLSFGPNQAIVVGQIVHAYVADPFVLNAERGFGIGDEFGNGLDPKG
jgi:hypothetical protein